MIDECQSLALLFTYRFHLFLYSPSCQLLTDKKRHFYSLCYCQHELVLHTQHSPLAANSCSFEIASQYDLIAVIFVHLGHYDRRLLAPVFLYIYVYTEYAELVLALALPTLKPRFVRVGLLDFHLSRVFCAVLCKTTFELNRRLHQHKGEEDYHCDQHNTPNCNTDLHRGRHLI